tara:strand:- start:716 stop:1087 length:372 start_codon:yes stop_codon:yes gene_type:complete
LSKIIFYSYSKCSTCKKASKWLDQKKIKYQLIDIVQKPPIYKYLDMALKQYISDQKRIFNKRGKSYKLIDCDINNLSSDEIIKFLLSDGKLIKRPFLVYEEKKIILGFSEDEFKDIFIMGKNL